MSNLLFGIWLGLLFGYLLTMFWMRWERGMRLRQKRQIRKWHRLITRRVLPLHIVKIEPLDSTLIGRN